MGERMSELAQRRPAPISSVTDGGWTRDQIELVKRTVIHGVGEATDDELRLFEYVCHATGLNPFLGQIWAIRRKEQIDGTWQERMTIQTGIAGYRLIAERTGRYEGRLGPYWCGPDGSWRDVWLDPKPPAACKVGILKHGFREPLWAVATFAEFAQRNRGGELTRFWRAMPANQLAKCAMALACREAFPQETSNLYTDAELPEADQATGEILADPGRLGGDPTPAQPAGATAEMPRSSILPTLDEIAKLDSIEAAKTTIRTAPKRFQALIPRAIADVHGKDPHWFWDNDTTVSHWQQALEYAIELHEHNLSEAGSVPPPASDHQSPSAQDAPGKGVQADGDPNPEGGDDGD
jgi:phage recombination protein Bet